jgi:hypothetical protein
MALITTIDNFDEFYSAMYENRREQFSLGAWEAIYDHLYSISEDMGKDMIVDCIAICCDFVEYRSVENFLNDYTDFSFSDDDLTDEEKLSEIEDYLNSKTDVIGVDADCILFQSF